MEWDCRGKREVDMEVDNFMRDCDRDLGIVEKVMRVTWSLGTHSKERGDINHEDGCFLFGPCLRGEGGSRGLYNFPMGQGDIEVGGKCDWLGGG